MRTRLTETLKSAMIAREARKVATLRLIIAAIKDRDIAAHGDGRDPLSDDEIIGVLSKMIKQRGQSIELYTKAGRDDLVAQESEEIDIITTFLPAQLDQQAMREAAEIAIRELDARSLTDVGPVMAQLRISLAGTADFSYIGSYLRDRLRM